MDNQLLSQGVLNGLGNPRLSKAVMAIHERPEHPWTLREPAQVANMSRAGFAPHFREVVGTTPFDYSVRLRIGVAQAKLRAGESLKIVAPAAGYASSTALTRAFSQRIGVSPTEWLARDTGNRPASAVSSL